MHVLITGASSFIGRHATAALSRADLEVTATCRSATTSCDRLTKLAPLAKLVQLDLARESDFEALPKRIDVIVHIAGVSVTPSTTADEMIECNVTGSRNLLNYARKARASRCIMASTLSVHGEIQEAVVNETTPIRAPDTYGASKYLAERLFASEASNLPTVAVRLPGVLGAGAHRAWLPIVLERLKSNADVTIYNPQASFNNAVHVDDLDDLFLKLIRNDWTGFHAFPTGAAGRLSVSDTVGLLASLLGSRSTIKEGIAAKGAFVISSDYAIKTFGYRPMEIGDMLKQFASESR